MKKNRSQAKARQKTLRQVMVRLAPETYERLTAMAEENKRSRSAQAALFVEEGLTETA